jgi:hypothetical protein
MVTQAQSEVHVSSSIEREDPEIVFHVAVAISLSSPKQHTFTSERHGYV